MTSQLLNVQAPVDAAKPRPVVPARPTVLGASTARGPATPETQSVPVPGADWVVEESFDATIEEIRPDAVRLHTVSLDGEEGEAWLPTSRIPESEQKWIALGVPVRVAIVFDRKAQPRKRENLVRVLRPAQWRAPVSDAVVEAIASKVLATAERLLARHADE